MGIYAIIYKLEKMRASPIGSQKLKIGGKENVYIYGKCKQHRAQMVCY